MSDYPPSANDYIHQFFKLVQAMPYGYLKNKALLAQCLRTADGIVARQTANANVTVIDRALRNLKERLSLSIMNGIMRHFR